MSLMEKIKERIEFLQTEDSPLENEYVYLKQVVEVIEDEKDLFSFDKLDMLTVLLIVNRRNMTFEDMLEVVSSLYDKECMDDVLELLIIIDNLKEMDILDYMWEEYNQVNVKELVDRFKSKTNLNKTEARLQLVGYLLKFKKIGEKIFDNQYDLKLFTQVIQDYDGDVIEDLDKMSNYRKNYEKIQFMKSKFFKKNLQPHLYLETSSGEQTQIVELLKEIDATPILQKISSKYFEIEKQRESYRKNKNKEKKLYNDVLEMLEKMNTEPREQFVIDDNISRKLPDEIYAELMSIVLEHNRKIFYELELNNIKNDKYNNVEKLFIKNGIYISELPVEIKEILLKNIQYEDLKKVLQYLSNKQW